MAGDWLKMRHDLPDDPAVIRLASLLEIDEDAVVGKLFRLWCWADRHTADGHAAGVGLGWVDRMARCDGFGAALVRVGWLVESDEGLTLPRFDRHCSDTAKARALDAARKADIRGRNGNVRPLSGSCPVATRTEPGPEKRRSPPPPREASQDGDGWVRLRAAWSAGPGRPWKPATPPDKAAARLAEPGWLDQAVEAIGRLKGCRYFDQPVTLVQLCGPGFVERVLGGQYDAAKAPRPRSPDERPPPRVDPAFESAKAATLAREEAKRKREHDRLDAAAGSDDETEAARAAMLAKLEGATP
jgi:hypothetical protein